MSDLRTAAKQALDWLGPDAPECCGCREEWQQAIDVLRAALAEDAMQRLTDVQQAIMESEIKTDKAEPVAWLFTNLQSGDYDFCFCADEHDHDREMWHRQPLYTAPLQRKPLTEDELEKAVREVWRNLPSEFGHTSSGWIELGIRYAEQAHGIGDNT